MSDLAKTRRERDVARQLAGLHKRRERVLERLVADLTQAARGCRCTVCRALRELDRETR